MNRLRYMEGRDLDEFLRTEFVIDSAAEIKYREFYNLTIDFARAKNLIPMSEVRVSKHLIQNHVFHYEQRMRQGKRSRFILGLRKQSVIVNSGLLAVHSHNTQQHTTIRASNSELPANQGDSLLVNVNNVEVRQ